MTRTEFITNYAARSGLSAKYACLGILEVGSATMFALPCGCGDDSCEGWAMVSASSALHHLFFSAPEPLRSAYIETVKERPCVANAPRPNAE